MPSPPRLRPLLLPVEHGGWGFLLEPIIVGLIAAPSIAGVWLALAALGAFLSRQPLKVAIDDWRHRRRVPRTPYAWAIAGGYALVALLALWAAAAAASAPFWSLAVIVIPLGLVTLWFDSRGDSRQLFPELAGASALGTVAAATARADGWEWAPALSLLASALVRVLPAIVTVRERVMRLHRRPAAFGAAIVAHALALLAATGGIAIGLMPEIVAGIVAALAARAAWHLRPGAPPEPAMRIGLRELATGLAAAVAIGVAWHGR